MRGERPGHTLQTTALVNEAYLRLAGIDTLRWRDRVHFFAMSATLMRRVLVDYARQRGREKRGAGVTVTSLNENAVAPQPAVDVVALDEALGRLAGVDPQQSRVVELRFFAGLSVEETADALGRVRATFGAGVRVHQGQPLRRCGANVRTGACAAGVPGARDRSKRGEYVDELESDAAADRSDDGFRREVETGGRYLARRGLREWGHPCVAGCVRACAHVRWRLRGGARHPERVAREVACGGITKTAGRITQHRDCPGDRGGRRRSSDASAR